MTVTVDVGREALRASRCLHFARERPRKMMKREKCNTIFRALVNGIPTVWNALSRIETSREIDRSTFYHILV